MRLPVTLCSAVLAMLIVSIVATEAGSLRNGEPGDLSTAAGWSPAPHAENLVPRSPLIVPGNASRLDVNREVEAFTALAGVSLWNRPETLPAPVYEPTDTVIAAAVPIPPAVTHSSCPALVVDAFTPVGAVVEACIISFCESRWQPGQVGDHGASLGWFQIQPQWHQAKADALFGPGADLMDPVVNVATAVVIFRDSGWSLWTTKTALASGVCPHGAIYPG